MLPPTHSKTYRLSDKRKAFFLQTIKWFLASGVSFVLVLTITIFSHEAIGLPEEFSLAIAMVVVLGVNFFTCRYLVFESTHGAIFKQIAGFATSVITFRVFEYLAFLLFHTLIGLPYLPVLICIQFGAFMLKFVVMRQFVFRKPIPENPN